MLRVLYGNRVLRVLRYRRVNCIRQTKIVVHFLLASFFASLPFPKHKKSQISQSCNAPLQFSQIANSRTFNFRPSIIRPHLVVRWKGPETFPGAALNFATPENLYIRLIFGPVCQRFFCGRGINIFIGKFVRHLNRSQGCFKTVTDRWRWAMF